MKSKLLGIILTIAVIVIFAACDEDDPQPTCVCETPHYLTCSDYNCTVSHSHSQEKFGTTDAGKDVYISAGVNTDGLMTKLNSGWNGTSGNTKTYLASNVTSIKVVTSGNATLSSGVLTINGTKTAILISAELDDVYNGSANAQSNDNVKMANGLQKINFCI